MSKRTILLIAILAIITIALLVLAILPSTHKQNPSLTGQNQQTNQPVVTADPGQTVLSLVPNIIQVSPNASYSSVAVTINTGSNKVTAV